MSKIAYVPANAQPIVGLESAPEILVDGYRGALVSDSIIKLNFVSLCFDASQNTTNLVGAVRLVLPVDEFADIMQGLNTLLADLQQRGLVAKSEGDKAS